MSHPVCINLNMHDEPILPRTGGNQSDNQLSFGSADGPLFDGLGQPRALAGRTHPSTGGSPDREFKAQSRIRELSAALRVDSDQDVVQARRRHAADRSRLRLERSVGDDLAAIRGNLTLVREPQIS